VGERRGERPHLADSANVREPGLQVLKAQQCLLPLGQVADEAGDDLPAAAPCLADSKLDREGVAIAVERGVTRPMPMILRFPVVR
jgi:hypothetical protein